MVMVKYTTTVKCTTQKILWLTIYNIMVFWRGVFTTSRPTMLKYHPTNTMVLIPWYFGAVYFIVAVSTIIKYTDPKYRSNANKSFEQHWCMSKA